MIASDLVAGNYYIKDNYFVPSNTVYMYIETIETGDTSLTASVGVWDVTIGAWSYFEFVKNLDEVMPDWTHIDSLPDGIPAHS